MSRGLTLREIEREIVGGRVSDYLLSQHAPVCVSRVPYLFYLSNHCL